jgi:rfaE bifunctional protein nucleotidyltransferase chain/domain
MLLPTEKKILTYPAALSLAKVLKSGCFRLVITNGCFDILHAGHVRYLEDAAMLGDLLMVGVNTDWAVKALKGPSRPINSTADRMLVVAAMACVSYVVPVDNVRVDEFVRGMKAAVWTKGGDYTLETLDQGEVAAAIAAGTKIEILPVVQQVSTTGIIQKVRI